MTESEIVAKLMQMYQAMVKIAMGKTETAEHAPLSHSKAGHSEAKNTSPHGGR